MTVTAIWELEDILRIGSGACSTCVKMQIAVWRTIDFTITLLHFHLEFALSKQGS